MRVLPDKSPKDAADLPQEEGNLNVINQNKFSSDQPRRDSVTGRNWTKIRIAAKTMTALNAVKDEVKIVGKEVRPPVGDIDMAYKEIMENAAPAKRWFIIMPRSSIKRSWELIVVLLLLYMLVAVPIRVCFNVEVEGVVKVIDLAIDILFIFDICINAVSAYIEAESNTIVVDPWLILRHYARTWLIIDLVASIPFYLIIPEPEEGGNTQLNKLSRIARIPRILKLMKLLRLLKLLKVLRMMGYVNMIEYHLGLNVAFARLAKVFAGVFIVTHFVGCLWFLTSWVEGSRNINDTWVHRYNLEDAHLSSQYLASVYWAFSTLTTVGFGDISALTNLERGFAVLCMVMGVSWYAFIISTFSTILSLFDRRSAKKKQNLSTVIQFMRDVNLPWDLRNKILHHVEYATNIESVHSEKDLPKVLELLSSQLQTEVLLHVHNDTIEAVHFFKGKTPQFIIQCVQQLKHIVVKEGEYISRKGEHCREMYFIKNGKAMIHLDNFNKNMLEVPVGSFFGEIGCIFQHIVTESVKAATQCDLLVLKKEDLWNLMEEFPEAGEEITQMAKLRLQKFKEIRSREKSSKKTIDLKGVLEKVKQKKDRREQQIQYDRDNNPLFIQKLGRALKTEKCTFCESNNLKLDMIEDHVESIDDRLKIIEILIHKISEKV